MRPTVAGRARSEPRSNGWPERSTSSRRRPSPRCPETPTRRRPDRARRRALDLLEAQRWRLAMFASDGWYWDDPIRPETRQVLRAAGRAARLVDREGAQIERRLVADLELLTSPSRGLDGAAIYRMALADVDQPSPADH